ncbi:MAG: hypothetical protein P4L67_02740 [Candidatus Pacebacteria bacterium]|nr:hypothetical protein [Candidatus Paceibacterota bacterium]
MNLSDIFKQFKNIVPDAGYTEKSRRAILASPQTMAIRERGIMIFLRSLETGVALVLAGFFILLATGSLSGGKYLAPVQYSVIDPNGLHAEAQAIDIQIQLANLDYSTVTSTSESTTATATAAVRALIIKGTGTATTSTATSTGADASSTAPAPLSVDQALQALTQ